ncbi:MAG: Fur family transcriptional regulator [Chitinophagales bacterium]
MKTAIQILKKNGLRQTNCRREVIKMFLLHDYAIAHLDLEQELEQFDRVTLYRTLNTFLTKGIVHKVPDGTGVTRYALCKDSCTEHQHDDDHIHFKCVRCDNIQCIKSVTIPTVQLPTGFTFLSANFLIQGICQSCQMN